MQMQNKKGVHNEETQNMIFAATNSLMNTMIWQLYFILQISITKKKVNLPTEYITTCTRFSFRATASTIVYALN
jgi:hypothetical protein